MHARTIKSTDAAPYHHPLHVFLRSWNLTFPWPLSPW